MSEDTQQLEVIPSGVMEQIERAQYDIAVSTAHKYPRSIKQFLSDSITLVQSDQETAESCIFRRPVGKKGGREEFAEGMSVRMSEIVAASYGNIVFQAQIIEQTPRYVKARGQCRDLQKNVSASSEVVESTVTKDGAPFSERMRIVVAKAALSKARRDAIFQVVPRALCKPIEAAARNVITGSTKPLSERRAAVIAWIGKSSIGEARVWAALGIKSVEELGSDQLVELQGLRTAIKEGEITIDDAFPKLDAPTTGVEAFAPKPEDVQPKTEKKAAKQPAAPPTTPDPQKPFDPWQRLGEILEAQEFTVSEFVECLVADDKLFGASPEHILGIDDISKKAATHYVGADGLGAEAVKSIAFVKSKNKTE